jgi:hypothetical protein
MKIKILIGLVLAVCSAGAGQLDNKFLKALNHVEASGKTGAIVGDNGKALGPYQIHRVYWEDVADKVGGKYSDVTNKAYAERVVNAYLNKYAPKAVAAKDYETLARIHNGGPRGATKPSTLGYWKKVQKAIDKPPRL